MVKSLIFFIVEISWSYNQYGGVEASICKDILKTTVHITGQ